MLGSALVCTDDCDLCPQQTAGEEVPVWDAAAETTNLDDAISAPLAEDVPAPESASEEPK
jgi:hypothetical protein